jgi:hypothetical protein
MIDSQESRKEKSHLHSFKVKDTSHFPLAVAPKEEKDDTVRELQKRKSDVDVFKVRKEKGIVKCP